MSLSDLQKKLSDEGTRTFTSQHERIMREGEQHETFIEKQGQEQLTKEMKTMSKNMKDMNFRKRSSSR